MRKSIPTHLLNDTNKTVLEYLEGKSAHSDTVEVWGKSLDPFEGVAFFCPDTDNFEFFIAYYGNTIIGYVEGMQKISYRLSNSACLKAKVSGGIVEKEIGKNWVSFRIFQNKLVEPDIKLWAKYAYEAVVNDNAA